jgi:hypothetical protein
LFFVGDQAYFLLPRNGYGRKSNAKPSVGYVKGELGTSSPPYQKWTWKDIDEVIYSPQVVHLPGKGVFVVTELDSMTRNSTLSRMRQDRSQRHSNPRKQKLRMIQHRKALIAVVVLLLDPRVLCLAQQAEKPPQAKAEIVSISKVGLPEEYRSDADIVRYKDHFYIAFAKPIQENENGFQILQSVDGRNWKSVATLRSEIKERRPDITYSTHYSGRPVWFSTMPSGRLCVTGRASEKTIVWSTDDGKDWREELDIKLSRSYSRVHWRNERAYCVSNESSSCGEKFEFFRLESADVDSAPKTVYKLSHNSHTLTGPRESQLVLAQDRAVCLLSFET